MNPEVSLLETIHDASDIKQLQYVQLEQLAEEIRTRIKTVVARTGGHLASNLGVVELTLALHTVYSFDYDRLVWDVGHQAYAHKLITGRNRDFDTLRTAGGISGYPNPEESRYDPFVVGHAGTAISTALGLLYADEAQRELDDELGKRPARRVVAVVGDASIASGMSFEGLNHAGDLGKRLLVVLNDNRMAISGTVGALSRYLNKVRTASIYNEIKREVRDFLDALPVVGRGMERILEQIKDAVRKSLVPGWIFEELGFRYFGPTDGHDVKALVEVMREIERLDIDGPVLLHVISEKGRGCRDAHADPRKFHGVSPGPKPPETEETPAEGEDKTVLNGKVEPDIPTAPIRSYTDVFSEALTQLAADDDRIHAITAAMPDGTGLTRFAEKLPKRFYDVGICEQHAVALAAGLAVGGLRPVLALYSTFLQRGYDQVFEEICLQNARVVVAMDRAGLVGSDGPTHHGTFDIAYLRAMPRITLMAPGSARELEMMLRFALALEGPSAIRYPRAKAPEVGLPEPETVELGRGQLLRDGADAALVAYGSMVVPAWQAAGILDREGVIVAVVNARFARPFDEKLISDVVGKTRVTLTLEEGCVNGGFGEGVLRLCAEIGLGDRVRVKGIPDRFIEHGLRDDLLAGLGLDAEGIAGAVREGLD